jgi:predicted esterase
MGRARSARRAALATLWAALSHSALARADVAIIPSSEGALGAWLVAGPIPASRAKDLDATAVKPASGVAPAGFPAFRPLSTRDGALDLDRALGTDKKAGGVALMGADLELSHDLDGWLLASIDGPFALWVDGEQKWTKPVARLRDGGRDAIPVSLAAGRHRIVFRLEHPGQWWATELALLDARDLLPPEGARLVLAGVDAHDAERLARDMLTSSFNPNPTESGYAPRVSLEYRRGAPAGVAMAVRAKVELGASTRVLRAGYLPTGPRGVGPFEVELPPVTPDATSVAVGVDVGPTRKTFRARLDPKTPALLARARTALSGLGSAKLRDAETTRATLEYFSNELRHGSSTIQNELERWVSELEAKRDPLDREGVLSFARRSPVDGEPDPTVLHVPKGGTAAGAKLPLVVALHGLNGRPERIVEVFLDTKSAAPSVPGFVLAPYAHGNAFYRGPGELEVLAAVDWALAHYPIDPERVSITGVSMGGTGTGHLALWYADRFTRAAPLCGYHSYFVRRDTSGRPIRPWEHARMEHWSPASFAERGRSLPMWVAHGTKDWPLTNSKVLVERYKSLGYDMTDEWPDTGHDVWTKAYAGARLFPWLAKARFDPSPARVTVKTDQLRFGELRWVRVTRLEQPSVAGTVDAEAKGPTDVRVHTEHVTAFELDRAGGRISRTEKVVVDVDGDKLELEPKEPVALMKRSGRWQKGAPPPSAKRAGLEGPIRDVFLEPLVFTYGTLDPRTARANREVAEALARKHGPDVRYRVIADRDLDAATESARAVVAVGTPRDHLLLAAVEAKLALRVAPKAIVVGQERFAQPGTGAIFVQPNPRHPDRYLLVVSGVDAAGIWRALSLPQLLPDFMVYDASLSPAAGEVVLGREARVLAAGFFDADWHLPPSVHDPEHAP